MSGRGWRQHPLLERIGYHLRRVRAWRRRATRLGLTLRLLVWASGAAGLLLALSLLVPPVAAAPIVLVAALLPAGYPAGRWASTLAVTAIAALGVGLRLVPPERPVPLLAATAVALYVHHSCAALAAQVRTDVVVPPAVLWHWAGRAGLALVGSAAVAVMAVAVPAPAWPVTGHVALGAAAAVAVAAALVWLVWRPDRATARQGTAAAGQGTAAAGQGTAAVPGVSGEAGR